MSPQNARFKPPLLLVVMLLARLALGAVYSFTVPLWEGNDEPYHYRFVRFIAAERRLPIAEERAQEMDAAHNLGQFAQPPLYYLLTAPFAALVDDGADPVPGPGKPPSACGDLPLSVSLFLHPLTEDFPWRGAALAAHLVRLVSVALVTAAALFTWMAARVAWPDRPAAALGAAGLAAFWPQFVYVGSLVNNDSLIIFTGALFLFFAVRAVTGPLRVADLVGLAVALGLCLLSKASGIALVAPAAVVLAAWLMRASAGRRRARLVAFAVLGAAAAAAVMGLVAIRGQVINGDPDPRYGGFLRAFYHFVENPSALFTSPWIKWRWLPAIFAEMSWSFVAAYGWQSIQVSVWVYALFGAWMLLAAVGLAVCAVRRRCFRSTLALLLTVVGAVLALTVYRGLVDGTLVAAGRYLAPAAGALALLGALGWDALPWPRRSGTRIAALLAPALLLSVWAPVLYIAPAYAPPPRLTEAQFAALPGVTSMNAQFTAGMRAVGYRVEAPAVVHPGEAVTLTLFLTTDRPIDAPYMTELVAIAPDGQGYGFCRATPGREQHPTIRWQPGEIIADSYAVPINAEFPAPASGFFSLSFYQPETGARADLIGPEEEAWGQYFHFGFDSFRVDAPEGAR